MPQCNWSHQSRRAPDLLLDVVHQKTEDALVLLPSLVNPAGCQLENNIWQWIVAFFQNEKWKKMHCRFSGGEKVTLGCLRLCRRFDKDLI